LKRNKNDKTQLKNGYPWTYSMMEEKYWYTAKIPRRCTNCRGRIKIGMTYYILPGAGVLCSDCGQKHLKTREKEKI